MASIFTTYNIILVVLALLLLVSIYAIFNLMKKVEKYQEITADHVQYLQNISTTIGASKKQLAEVDSKGTFSADDEVGFFFETLKVIQEELNRYMLPENYGKEEKQS